MEEFKQSVGYLSLEPITRGRFEVRFDDEMVYSKLETGSFPDGASVMAAASESMD